MDNIEAIRQATREFVLNEFLAGEDPSVLSDDTPLISGGILDSIAVVRLVNHLEGRFSVNLTQSDIDFERFNTVKGITSTIGNKLNNQQ